ncbi:DinB family protein [Deinococcus yavapaiensis]|uniref:Putative damage-inducible protein DinB n=1 Tax=Deinococcus yavapaiensis KR-236 TaxID=694435 RepID=A0A318SQZ6_9DEIO|nr:DinB family protein [Deinococcus yavapaiensis]PYE55343.1 putative damage-inducible protein DinB [Deinococcus yavapaiensis KR-236]
MNEMSGTEDGLRDLSAVWRANAEVNAALLKHLTPEMLSAVTPGGGFTVAEHLAHMVGTTKYWGSLRSEDAMRGVPTLYDENARLAETDITRVRDAFERTRDDAWQAAFMLGGQPNEWGEGPHASPTAFLAHMLIHDAHHRGQILLALKTNGFPLPGEDALWAPLREAR